MLEDSRKHFQPNDVLTRRGGSAVVKKTFRVVTVAALLLAAVLPLHGQLPKDPEERKKASDSFSRCRPVQQRALAEAEFKNGRSYRNTCDSPRGLCVQETDLGQGRRSAASNREFYRGTR